MTWQNGKLLRSIISIDLSHHLCISILLQQLTCKARYNMQIRRNLIFFSFTCTVINSLNPVRNNVHTFISNKQTKAKFSTTSERRLSSETESAIEAKSRTAVIGADADAASNVALLQNQQQQVIATDTFSYGAFAKQYPYANNLIIATAKTAAADLLAQTVISGTPLTDVDLQRSFLFCLFGCLYLGAFQYAYQVQVFKKLFPSIEDFTRKSWQEKFSDLDGLQTLAKQTVLDLTVLTAVYLPAFYIFKASVFSGSLDPSIWLSTGIENYVTNFIKDEVDLIRVWLPADLICFSVPLYLRLPVRHIVSFVWTAYLSFARGGH